jgi:hypothetical protein
MHLNIQAFKITLQVLVKNTMKFGINLLEINRVKSSEFLKTLIDSNKFDKIVYLVEIVGYKITPEVLSFAVDKYSCDSKFKKLILYLKGNDQIWK